ncbi:MAG: AI-2E family transporter [Gulosibacter sp.]|uniref:AI-2E family transporter n=1 Tax=Gulosibacter sp. TaxID=2817531 RepID=UPI003F93B480
MTEPNGDLPSTPSPAQPAADSIPEQVRVADTDSTSGSTSTSASTPLRYRPKSTQFITTAVARPVAVGFSLTIGGLLAILLGLAISDLTSILISTVLALFIALGLDPVVRMIQGWGASRTWAIVIVCAATVVAFLAIIGLLIPIIVDQLTSFFRGLPAFIDDFMTSTTYAWLTENFGDGITSLIEQAQDIVLNPATLATIGGGVLEVGAGLVGGVSSGIIVFVLTLYFTASLESMKNAFYRLAPAWNRERVADLTERITQSVGAYLKGMVVLAFFNAIIVLILYSVLGLPFPPLMAVGAFFITIIPLIGTVAFWVLGSAIALFADPVSAIIFAVVYLIYMQVEAYVLTPRVMSRAISVPGSLVVIGAMVGGTLLGFLGALVAIPVTASILLIIKEVVVPHQDAKTEPDLP